MISREKEDFITIYPIPKLLMALLIVVLHFYYAIRIGDFSRYYRVPARDNPAKIWPPKAIIVGVRYASPCLVTISHQGHISVRPVLQCRFIFHRIYTNWRE